MPCGMRGGGGQVESMHTDACLVDVDVAIQRMQKRGEENRSEHCTTIPPHVAGHDVEAAQAHTRIVPHFQYKCQEVRRMGNHSPL